MELSECLSQNYTRVVARSCLYSTIDHLHATDSRPLLFSPTLSLSDLLLVLFLIRIEKKKSRVLFSSLELNYPQVQGKIEDKIIEFSRD